MLRDRRRERQGRRVVFSLLLSDAGPDTARREVVATFGLVLVVPGVAAVAYSAGSEPGDRVNPAAVAAMAEVGIDIAGARPRRWTDANVRAADVVVSMGCGDSCTRYEDWVLPDPFGKDVEEVRPTRDEIGRRVRDLLLKPGCDAA